jgi:predicted 3-demethylubiquinone-9 3-methyltransferase (glyoxalase superfamily)
MQKIVPFLWFNTEAGEAARFYETVFPDTKIRTIATLEDTPSGTVENITLDLMGYELQMMSVGPLFKINPSISFSVNLKTKEEAKALWDRLSQGGIALMEFNTYPWSEGYGWCNDKFGVSWQIMTLGDVPISQNITPALMFTQELVGNAEPAMEFYTEVFKNSKINGVFRYTKDQAPDKEGTIAHANFTLDGEQFMALDSAQKHEFKFNEGVSLVVYCGDQAEIDYFWEKLSAVPESEQCGWLKDKFGVSWQIVPREMDAMMRTKDKEALARVTQAFLQMKKFDLAKLRAAFNDK